MDNREEAINKICDYWANCLISIPVHELGSDLLNFELNSLPITKVIEQDKVDRFRQELFDRIVQISSNEEIVIYVDYKPNLILKECAKKADIDCDYLDRILPKKTHTIIWENENVAYLKEGYGVKEIKL